MYKLEDSRDPSQSECANTSRALSITFFVGDTGDMGDTPLKPAENKGFSSASAVSHAWETVGDMGDNEPRNAA